MKSVMTKDFSRIAQTEITRSTFNRGHGYKTAFDSGYLVPVELQEVLPGDTVEFDARFMARLAPVVTPVFDSVFLDAQAFFVPSRLLWNNFTKMMGERKNPNDSIDFTVPQIALTRGKLEPGTLADYFGIPLPSNSQSGDIFEVNALPFRAYQKIYDDWYRDENLQDSVIQSSDELGDQTYTGSLMSKYTTLRKRGKRHDYFTSALPSPQRGVGASLPLGTTAPVEYVGANGSSSDFTSSSVSIPGGNTYQGVLKSVVNGSPDNLGAGALVADLSDATAATINSLRMAFQLQGLLEADMRAGTRYTEILRQHFKCICPDARLQRSEFLGQSSTPITFSPVAQTSATVEGGTPQGTLTSTAHCFGELKFTRSFSEHGYLLVLVSVRCDLNYQQGLDRLWSRKTRYDFYWPLLAHLGEQEVLNKEIYYQPARVVDDVGNSVNDGIFGYQERYAEYRYNPSRITGKLRSGVAGSLDVWHLAQYFTDLPVLSSAFIEEDPPLDRVLAVQEGEPQVIFQSYLGQVWTRPLPVYSIPGLINRF